MTVLKQLDKLERSTEGSPRSPNSVYLKHQRSSDDPHRTRQGSAASHGPVQYLPYPNVQPASRSPQRLLQPFSPFHSTMEKRKSERAQRGWSPRGGDGTELAGSGAKQAVGRAAQGGSSAAGPSSPGTALLVPFRGSPRLASSPEPILQKQAYQMGAQRQQLEDVLEENRMLDSEGPQPPQEVYDVVPALLVGPTRNIGNIDTLLGLNGGRRCTSKDAEHPLNLRRRGSTYS